jgi:hypothetical protein
MEMKETHILQLVERIKKEFLVFTNKLTDIYVTLVTFQRDQLWSAGTIRSNKELSLLRERSSLI